MTQVQRILTAAKAFNGTCQADWLSDYTPDGGPRITRVAARIQDLKDTGHCFEILHDRKGTRVYRLVEDSEARRASVESDTHKMCGSSEISPGVPLAPDGGSTGASGERRPAAVVGSGPALAGTIGQASGVPVESPDVEVGRSDSDQDGPHAGPVGPPTVDLSTGRLFEVGEPVSTHYEDEAA